VGREPEVVRAAVPEGARILELGCGAGRVTRPLTELGFTVTAVDESPEMLERLPDGVNRVCGAIETLDLPERFDVVLLGSHLVNAGDAAYGRALLRTCRRHVSADGCVLVERDADEWHDRVPFEADLPGGGRLRALRSEPDGPELRRAQVEYVFADARWTHTFHCRRLTPESFERALAEAGLVLDTYLTDDRTWARARPATPHP
jgi:SAM-dependent methyltransferase